MSLYVGDQQVTEVYLGDVPLTRAVLGDILLAGDASVVAVDDRVTGTGNLQWEYAGTWGVSNIDHYSGTAGSTATLRFRGTRVQVYGARDAHHGNASFLVDAGAGASAGLGAGEVGSSFEGYPTVPTPLTVDNGGELALDNITVGSGSLQVVAAAGGRGKRALQVTPALDTTATFFRAIAPAEIRQDLQQLHIDWTHTGAPSTARSFADFRSATGGTLRGSPWGMDALGRLLYVDSTGSTAGRVASTALPLGRWRLEIVFDSGTGTTDTCTVKVYGWDDNTRYPQYEPPVVASNFTTTSGIVALQVGKSTPSAATSWPPYLIHDIRWRPGTTEDYGLTPADTTAAAVTVDSYAPGRELGVLLFDSGLLTNGDHTLVCSVLGTKRAASSGTVVAIDRGDVISTGGTETQTDALLDETGAPITDEAGQPLLSE